MVSLGSGGEQLREVKKTTAVTAAGYKEEKSEQRKSGSKLYFATLFVSLIFAIIFIIYFIIYKTI